jgi:hypothetical protein
MKFNYSFVSTKTNHNQIMKLFLSKLTALSFAFLMAVSSCTEKDKPGDPDDGGEPNIVTGIVVDAQGNPLSGVKVRAENPTGDNIHVDGTTGADGKYSLQITSIGGWKIYAWKNAEYKGNMFHLRMGMKDDADYNAFSTNGKTVVKNFVWKLNGIIPDRDQDVKNGFGYFGGTLLFVNINNLVPQMPAGTKVVVTLTPTAGAKYIDGQTAPAANVITKTFTMRSGVDQNYYINDIPVTEYRISIDSEQNGVHKQVYVGTNTSNLYEWLELDFLPALGSSGSYENGIMGPTDAPYYMGQKP